MEHIIEEEVRNIANIDYGHFLPYYEGKCNRLHYHTSWNISITLKGRMVEGERMLIDFIRVKELVKQTLAEYDHKMILPSYTVKKIENNIVFAEYENRKLELPRDEVVISDKDSTAENIANHIAEMILTRLPPHIFSLILHFGEGVNNYIHAKVERKWL
jgi:6-pyruvoyl-tetrahydropterin synthase